MSHNVFLKSFTIKKRLVSRQIARGAVNLLRRRIEEMSRIE